MYLDCAWTVWCGRKKARLRGRTAQLHAGRGLSRPPWPLDLLHSSTPSVTKSIRRVESSTEGKPCSLWSEEEGLIQSVAPLLLSFQDIFPNPIVATRRGILSQPDKGFSSIACCGILPSKIAPSVPDHSHAARTLALCPYSLSLYCAAQLAKSSVSQFSAYCISGPRILNTVQDAASAVS